MRKKICGVFNSNLLKPPAYFMGSVLEWSYYILNQIPPFDFSQNIDGGLHDIIAANFCLTQ